MKKLLYTLSLLPFITIAQINITHSNLPNIGDTVITGMDFATGVVGSAGANQFWDFSSLGGTPEMLLGFIDPTTTPYQSTFPTSNICAQVDSASFYYLNRSTNGLAALGFVDNGTPFPFNEMLLPTPINYQDTIIKTSIKMDSLMAVFPPITIPGTPYIIDSIRAKNGNISRYIADGWGQIQIPFGTYDCLRILKETLTFDSVYLHIASPFNAWGIDTPSCVMYWEESQYNWRTDATGLGWSLIEAQLDSSRIPTGDITYFMGSSISHLIISPPMVDIDDKSNASCYGACDGKLILDVFGTATPFTYSWTGPNGFTSSNQDIYNLCAGNYSVIVTDINGNSFTDSWDITEPNMIGSSISNYSGFDLTSSTTDGNPPFTYLWNTSETTQTITATANGDYWCIVTDSKGCKADTAFFTITTVSIENITQENKIIKIIDILGQKSKHGNNTLLFYIYDNGRVEKKIIVE